MTSSVLAVWEIESELKTVLGKRGDLHFNICFNYTGTVGEKALCKMLIIVISCFTSNICRSVNPTFLSKVSSGFTENSVFNSRY